MNGYAPTVRGYVRVLEGVEDSSLQIGELRAAGVEDASVVVERGSGSRADSPALEELLGTLQPGEVLVVTSLDRLGTSLTQLVHVGDVVHGRGAHLRALAEGVDTSRPDGPALLAALAVLAGFQRDVGSRSTREGLAAARTRGKRAGRPPRLDPDQAAEAQRLYDAGSSMAQIALRLGVPRTTVYGHVRQRPRTD